MIQDLPTESRLISDTDPGDEIPEQPIVVGDYSSSECVCLITWDGNQVTVPYRMVKEVTKVMNQYVNANKEK